MQKLMEEISEKKLQICVLEQRMIGSLERSPQMSNNIEMSQVNYASSRLMDFKGS